MMTFYAVIKNNLATPPFPHRNLFDLGIYPSVLFFKSESLCKFSMRPAALIVFAKRPFPGRVNTRLQPRISPRDSARLQEQFIRDTLAKIPNLRELDTFLGYAPSEDPSFFEDLRDQVRIKLLPQEGQTLGIKIQNAFSVMFRRGYRKVVIIGVDSPTFPPQFITEALRLLDTHDIVLGPTTDGGYYLAGMKERYRAIFPNHDLGTAEVLKEALERCSREGLKVSSLPPWYDLDRVPDLEFALTHIHLLAMAGKYFPPGTRELLEELLPGSK